MVCLVLGGRATQRNAWLEQHRWTYGVLGEELVAEGRNRLHRFRGYVRRPGTWENPTWKQDCNREFGHVKYGGSHMIYLYENFTSKL